MNRFSQREAFIATLVFTIRKEIEHDIVEAEAIVRKEELDIDAEGAVEVDRDRDRRQLS